MSAVSLTAFEADLHALRQSIEDRLHGLHVGSEDLPEDLMRSVRHSLLAPAKRLRAILVTLSADAFCVPRKASADSACALEMVHTASLVLDDLPCMDDANLRRGRPTNHSIYGENTAILAAIGMISEGFAVLTREQSLTCDTRLDLVRVLGTAIGYQGLVAGQYEDLQGGGQARDLDSLIRMHARKTGALFSAAAEMGGCLGGASADDRRALHDYGMNLGLAFQAYDDLIDVMSNQMASGKDVAQDDDRTTLVTMLGISKAHETAKLYLSEARALAQRHPDWACLDIFCTFLEQKVLTQIDLRLNKSIDGHANV